jgi:hypothetical protein
MQSYYLSGSNQNVFRIEQTTSPTFTMHYENMMTLTSVTQSLTAEYTSSESIIKFTSDISGAVDGGEYRAYLEDGADNKVWYGTYKVFSSSSLDKSAYKSHLDNDYKSNVTTNEYIMF